MNLSPYFGNCNVCVYIMFKVISEAHSKDITVRHIAYHQAGLYDINGMFAENTRKYRLATAASMYENYGRT